jgi:tetratricopeptide (TPR) repeat protein
MQTTINLHFRLLFFFLLGTISSICTQTISVNQWTVLTQEYIQEEATNSLERWNHYLRNDLDSLKLDAKFIYTIGVRGNHEFAKNSGLRSLGSYLIRTGKPERGIVFLKKASHYFKLKGNWILHTEILNEIGNGYLNWSKPLQAKKYFLLSLQSGKKSPDPTSEFLAKINLAQAYVQLDQLEKAIVLAQDYKSKAIKYKKYEAVANAYALLGTIAEQRLNIPLAKEYYTKSAFFGFKSNAKSQIAQAYTNQAIVYFQEGKANEALHYFNKALVIRLQTNNGKAICESYYNLGAFYTELNKLTDAEMFYHKSREYAKSKKLLRDELDALMALKDLASANGNSEKSLAYLEEYVVLQDKQLVASNTTTLHDMELIEHFEKLEFQQKERNTEKRLTKLVAENARTKRNIFLFFAGCIVVILALFYYFR